MSDPRLNPEVEAVCIFGSRDYPDLKHVKKAVDKLKRGTIVVVGRARGVDSAAEFYAKERGLEVWPYPAKWNGEDGKQPFNPIAGFERNSAMVEVSDRGIAFHYRKSSGTQDTINKFKREGKRIEVIEYETTKSRG